MKLKHTELLSRLSKEDELIGEYESIQTQKAMLEEYTRLHGFINIVHYTDDGYSGTNFDRPEFQRLVNDIKNNLIDTVIVKDLSRLGRDYLKTEYYLEEFFPSFNVRFVAINDDIDSNKGIPELTPFKNIMNEWYAKDISKKIRSAYRVKAMKGEFTAAYAPYGYKKDSIDKHHLIIDEDGNYVVKYSYDTFGVPTITYTDNSDVAKHNPFRYMGYYYDEETGFYYLNSRYYNPDIMRFISIDDSSYLDPYSYKDTNLYAYCYNNPVMYSDGDGNFPILACILGISALVGMGLTIGGVASDNSALKSIGLSMVAIPALISGGMAVACFGAWGTMAVGAGTVFFASAEYQEAFTGNNWMLNAGMSQELYNGLMLTTAALATLGKCASALGAYNYHSFGNQHWNDGWRKMRGHYWKHGISEMKYSNVYSYTKGAKNVISSGKYIEAKNAYALLVSGKKVAFVGVGQGNALITTFSYRTLSLAKMALYGLL